MSLQLDVEQQTLNAAEQTVTTADTMLTQLSQQLSRCQEEMSQLERQEGMGVIVGLVSFFSTIIIIVLSLYSLTLCWSLIYSEVLINASFEPVSMVTMVKAEYFPLFIWAVEEGYIGSSIIVP